MLKVIFLDIDGVLNSTSDFLESRFEFSINHKTDVISPGKLAILEIIINETGAKVVISSSWRELYSLDEIHDMFVKRGWTLPRDTIIGKTTESHPCSINPSESSRPYKINIWMEECKEEIDSYVILDDMDDHYFRQEHGDLYIQTEFANGLNSDHINEVVEILGRTPEAQKAHEEKLELYQEALSYFV